MSNTFTNFFSEKIDDLKKRASELGIQTSTSIRKQELKDLIKINILQDKPENIMYIYGPSVPKKYYEKIMNEDNKKGKNCYNYEKKYKMLNFLGKGAYGSTSRLCKNSDEKKNDCEYVLKTFDFSKNKSIRHYLVESFLTEIQALVELGKTGFVPKIYNAWICGDKAYYIMELLEKINFGTDYFDFRKAKHMLEVFEKLGWVHADTHKGNLMKDKNGNLKWIDFGFAAKKNVSQNKNENPVYRNHLLNIIYKRGITSWDFLKYKQYNILYESMEKYDHTLQHINAGTNFGKLFYKPLTEKSKKKTSIESINSNTSEFSFEDDVTPGVKTSLKKTKSYKTISFRDLIT
jgi:thiamine kinase-like enzyme